METCILDIMCVYIYIYIYICVCVCIYIYIYMRVFVQKENPGNDIIATEDTAEPNVALVRNFLLSVFMERLGASADNEVRLDTCCAGRD